MENGKLTKKSRISRKTIEVLCLLAIILLIGIPAYHLDHLPEQIPSHFDFLGKADGFSNKSVIWTLPIIGVVLYIILTLVGRIPFHKQPMDPTPIQDQKEQHEISMHLVAMLKMIVLWIFVIMIAQVVYIAHEETPALPYGLTAGFLVAIFGTIFYYVAKMRRV